MGDHRDRQERIIAETERLKTSVRKLGVDSVGIAELRTLQGMPIGISSAPVGFLAEFKSAIVLGARLGDLVAKSSGIEVNLHLEKAALETLAGLEERGYRGLIVHTEDEFDPVHRYGLLSLKVLAKAAGLGWQGRSLLIISPKHGPLHRLIAILTDGELQADRPIANQCGNCTSCIDACPHHALKLAPFEDHPQRREDVLDVGACQGDEGCRVCLVVCPWARRLHGSRARESRS